MHYLRIVVSLLAGIGALIMGIVTAAAFAGAVERTRAGGMWGGTLGDLMEGKHRQVQTTIKWDHIGFALGLLMITGALGVAAYFAWP
ncbi:MAG TPA: hypothetical protein VMR52_00025 [Dehalococcoidia bacterium]|nr:hypothetical protein [Dehalococcoidia bacterium]